MHEKMWAVLGGVTLALLLNNTIAGIMNKVLTPLGITYV